MTERLIFGADLSTKRLAFVAGTSLDTWLVNCIDLDVDTYNPKILPTVERETSKAIDAAFDHVDKDIGLLAVIESPVVGRGNAQVTIKQSFISGVVQNVFACRGADIIMLSNTQWKSDVVGKGNASKEQCKEWLNATWPNIGGAAGSNQDLVDAACLYGYGLDIQRKRRALERGGSLPK